MGLLLSHHTTTDPPTTAVDFENEMPYDGDGGIEDESEEEQEDENEALQPPRLFPSLRISTIQHALERAYAQDSLHYDIEMSYHPIMVEGFPWSESTRRFSLRRQTTNDPFVLCIVVTSNVTGRIVYDVLVQCTQCWKELPGVNFQCDTCVLDR